jgi:hypothetical protein
MGTYWADFPGADRRRGGFALTSRRVPPVYSSALQSKDLRDRADEWLLCSNSSCDSCIQSFELAKP